MESRLVHGWMVESCAAKDRRPAGNSNRLCMFTKLDLKSFGRHLGMLGRVELMGRDGLDCGETCKIVDSDFGSNIVQVVCVA